MHPIGNYIKIRTLPKPEVAVIVESECYTKAIALEVSPDLKLPFKNNAEIFILESQIIYINNNQFILIDYIGLHN